MEEERRKLQEQRAERKRVEEERKQKQEEEREAKLKQMREEKEQSMAKKEAEEAEIVKAVPTARWVPKPETDSGLGNVAKPPPLAENPVYVRPPLVVVRATKETVTVAVTRTAAPLPKVAAVKAPPVVAPKPVAKKPVVATTDNKTDSKARLKLVYAVFVAGTGALAQTAVAAQLESQGHSWTDGETLKTLNMLVVLKLLQKDDTDTWRLK